jgi:thioredoxin reductase
VSEVDVAVVGAGPAGLAAATLCAGYGLATALFDEQPAVGGQIYRGGAATRSASAGLAGGDLAHGAALARAFAAAGAAHLPGATVWAVRAAASGAIELCVACDARGPAPERAWTARAAIIAAGAYERPFPFPGWTLPGVMTAGAAQVLLKSAALVPRGRVVLAGSGPLLWLVAAQLLEAGAALDALLETVPRGRLASVLRHAPSFLASPYFREGLDLARRVRRRTRVIEYVTALAAEGGARVERVRFRADGTERVLAADALFVHQGVVPSLELAAAAGCATRWSDARACFEPVADAWGGTTVPSLWVAGDGAGVAGAQAAESGGRLAALAVVNALGRIDGVVRDREAVPHRRALAGALRGRRFIDALYRPADAFRLPDAATVVCRCEEVTAAQVIDAARAGCAGPAQAKAFLRCGMGPCQGRMCGLTVTELIARSRGVAPSDVGHFRSRFPVKPVPLAEIAGLPSTPRAEAAVVREHGTH